MSMWTVGGLISSKKPKTMGRLVKIGVLLEDAFQLLVVLQEEQAVIASLGGHVMAGSFSCWVRVSSVTSSAC